MALYGSMERLRGGHEEAAAHVRCTLPTGAADGDRDALTAVIRQVQHPMYRLALRFLGHPEDAQDACQEILIRIITQLGTFEGRSAFMTWAYTVATRSLPRTRTRLIESSVHGAERFAAFLDTGLGDIDPTMEEAEYRLLCDEVRISGTYGILLCLSRPLCAAYLLADVLGLSDVEGAAILECGRAAFRQRVTRARRTLRYVIDNRCGLTNPANPAAKQLDEVVEPCELPGSPGDLLLRVYFPAAVSSRAGLSPGTPSGCPR